MIANDYKRMQKNVRNLGGEILEKKYQLDQPENQEFFRQLGMELLEFGKKFPAPQGGSYYLGDDGTPWKDRPVETWITCRMTHVYSMGKMMGVSGAEELAKKGLQGLQGILKDTINGGFYAGVQADGSILPDKQCYAHAFVILASSSAKLAGIPGAEGLLEEALEVYDRYFWDDTKGLAVDTWNTEFTELSSYRGINANMHTVEAFLAVADACKSDLYRQRAGRIIGHVVAWAKENHWRIPEHFREDWSVDLFMNEEKKDDPFKPYGATPGHGIEWARLISQWAVSTYQKEEDRKEYIEAAELLFMQAVQDGWNADGSRGIVYTTDWNGRPVVRDRMHWTLAEAINTSAVLYRITGKEQYTSLFTEFCSYLDEEVLDHENGSWFHQLDEQNQLKGTVWPGKSDLYHAFQAMLIPYGDISVSVATMIKRKYENE